jgi:predicted TIM-barrel fold metal-dependent hydrolase
LTLATLMVALRVATQHRLLRALPVHLSETRAVRQSMVATGTTILRAAGDLLPPLHRALQLFGAGRCTFESNFPVDKSGIGYAALWNAFKRIAAAALQASVVEKRALFSGTGRRVYRLD